jgi:hypothetical protein
MYIVCRRMACLTKRIKVFFTDRHSLSLSMQHLMVSRSYSEIASALGAYSSALGELHAQYRSPRGVPFLLLSLHALRLAITSVCFFVL